MVTLTVDMRDIYPSHTGRSAARPRLRHARRRRLHRRPKHRPAGESVGLHARAGLSRVLIGPLAGNPFPDATPEFFTRWRGRCRWDWLADHDRNAVRVDAQGGRDQAGSLAGSAVRADAVVYAAEGWAALRPLQQVPRAEGWVSRGGMPDPTRYRERRRGSQADQRAFNVIPPSPVCTRSRLPPSPIRPRSVRARGRGRPTCEVLDAEIVTDAAVAGMGIEIGVEAWGRKSDTEPSPVEISQSSSICALGSRDRRSTRRRCASEPPRICLRRSPRHHRSRAQPAFRAVDGDRAVAGVQHQLAFHVGDPDGAVAGPELEPTLHPLDPDGAVAGTGDDSGPPRHRNGQLGTGGHVKAEGR